MSPADDLLCEGLVAAALAAGREILDVYAGPIEVARKADASPVTAADGRAEAVILAALAELAPGVPVVAEESAAAGRLPVVGNRFFLVDPLDGTEEFISRNGEFTVNIALIEDRRPVLGVVYAPVFGRLFVGGGNAAREAAVIEGRAGAFAAIATRAVSPAGLVVVGSRSHGAARSEAFARELPAADYRISGSSLKFCLIAAGQADLYPRFGRTMEWDTAAGDAVLRAAGGMVVDMAGTPLVYGKQGGGAEEGAFVNGDFIAASCPALEVLRGKGRLA